jgi:hypothetical protein
MPNASLRQAQKRSPGRNKALSENRAAKIAQRHNSDVSLGSNLNETGFPIRSFGKSGWWGFKRKLFSTGTITLGTCKTAEVAAATQSSPIALILFGGGYAAQFFGKEDTSIRAIRFGLMLTGTAT